MSLLIPVGACNLKECHKSGLLKRNNGRWALSKSPLAGLCDIWAQGFSHVGGLWFFYFKPFPSNTALPSRSRSFYWLNTAKYFWESALVTHGVVLCFKECLGWGVAPASQSTQSDIWRYRCLTQPTSVRNPESCGKQNRVELRIGLNDWTGCGLRRIWKALWEMNTRIANGKTRSYLERRRQCISVGMAHIWSQGGRSKVLWEGKGNETVR